MDVTNSVPSNATTQGYLNRRSSNYHPSIWGDHFLDASFNDMEQNGNLEEESRIETLKVEVVKMLSNAMSKTVDEVTVLTTLVDELERLGVAYHFENQITEALLLIYNNYVSCNHDANFDQIALQFRLLRQHGFNVSANALGKLKDEEDETFKGELTKDVGGLLRLYEASQVRVKGEETEWEQAYDFSKKHLKSLLPSLGSTCLAEQVKHALQVPLHRGMPRLEAKHYISTYDPSSAPNINQLLLLELAKLDFNLLQTLHRRELSDISRWWKEIDFATKLPFARDRLVECYFWILGVYFEPKHSNTRKFMTKIIAIASVLDDIYDVYGSLEELNLFTRAIERWEVVAANELPKYMQVCYVALLDVVKEMEKKLTKNKEPIFSIHYAKEAIKGLVRAYMVEAKWFNAKYVPTFEEYMGNSTMSSGYPMLAVQALIGLKDATKEALDWAISVPKIIRSSALIARLVDDIHTYKVERERGDAASGVDCYMQQHGVSEEEACSKIKGMVESAWVDINGEIQDQNRRLPLAWLRPSLNLARMMEVLYQNGDGYTNSSGRTKDTIASLLLHPIPI